MNISAGKDRSEQGKEGALLPLLHLSLLLLLHLLYSLHLRGHICIPEMQIRGSRKSLQSAEVGRCTQMGMASSPCCSKLFLTPCNQESWMREITEWGERESQSLRLQRVVVLLSQLWHVIGNSLYTHFSPYYFFFFEI